MSENPRRGRQARNLTKNVPKILDLKSSSEQIFFRKLSLGAPAVSQAVEELSMRLLQSNAFFHCCHFSGLPRVHLHSLKIPLLGHCWHSKRLINLLCFFLVVVLITIERKWKHDRQNQNLKFLSRLRRYNVYTLFHSFSFIFNSLYFRFCRVLSRFASMHYNGEHSKRKSRLLRKSDQRFDNSLRWCYTGQFATTIFNATQHYSIVATLFQHCNAVLRWKSSLQIVWRVTSPFDSAPSPSFLLYKSYIVTHLQDPRTASPKCLLW